ncbi:MAG: TetR family transcriptional regulator C-terminal domain-containing protein [Alphaproteobacteria bacterium]
MRLIEAGAQLIWAQGFHATGLAEILAAAEVPKGSFYHFFADKAAFGLAVIDWFAAERLTDLQDALARDDLKPLDRLRAYYQDSHRTQMALGPENGSPLGNLALELGRPGNPFAAAITIALQREQTLVMHCLAEAKDSGQLPAGVEPEGTARYLQAAWEGAVLQMKVTGGAEPLDAFLALSFGRLLQS